MARICCTVCDHLTVFTCPELKIYIRSFKLNNFAHEPGFTSFVAKTNQSRFTCFWGKTLYQHFHLCKMFDILQLCPRPLPWCLFSLLLTSSLLPICSPVSSKGFDVPALPISSIPRPFPRCTFPCCLLTISTTCLVSWLDTPLTTQEFALQWRVHTSGALVRKSMTLEKPWSLDWDARLSPTYKIFRLNVG